MGNEQQVYDVLNELGIKYIKHEHPPVFTVEEANQHYDGVSGIRCKNLFLRNRKGDKHYLVIVEDSKPVNLKDLSSQIGSAGPLSFASAERLMKYLGLVAGAVSPFGLINDVEKHVHVYLDKDFAEGEEINFHPNVNTATLTLSIKDFLSNLSWCKNKVGYVKL